MLPRTARRRSPAARPAGCSVRKPECSRLPAPTAGAFVSRARAPIPPIRAMRLPNRCFTCRRSIPTFTSSGCRQSIPVSSNCGRSGSTNPSEWKMTGSSRACAHSRIRWCAGKSCSRYIVGDRKGRCIKARSSQTHRPSGWPSCANSISRSSMVSWVRPAPYPWPNPDRAPSQPADVRGRRAASSGRRCQPHRR